MIDHNYLHENLTLVKSAEYHESDGLNVVASTGLTKAVAALPWGCLTVPFPLQTYPP